MMTPVSELPVGGERVGTPFLLALVAVVDESEFVWNGVIAEDDDGKVSIMSREEEDDKEAEGDKGDGGAVSMMSATGVECFDVSVFWDG
jgi:hypothetical protein